jgi:hypothetical protein
MESTAQRTRSLEPLPTRSSELPDIPTAGVRRVGALRVPLAGPYRPWAVLFRMPDGRLLWSVRLWEVDHVERRLFSTNVLRAYADRSGLARLRSEIDDLVAGAVGRDGRA